MTVLRAAWAPLGCWRSQLVWRFFGVVVFQIDMMLSTLRTTPAEYLALPWPFFAHLAAALLLVLCGPRLLTLLLVGLASLTYLLRVVLTTPEQQLAEEYLVLVGLPIAAVLLALLAGCWRGSEAARRVDDALMALVRWTALTALFFAAFHKLNHDFFDATVSCGADLLRWFTLVVPGAPALPESVARAAPFFAVLGEGLIPLLLLLVPRLGILCTVLVMGTIGHGNTTGFTSLVLCLATSFLAHEDGAILARALRRRWPLLLVLLLLTSHLSSRIYSGTRWFEYQVFEVVLLAAGLATLELLFAALHGLWSAAPAQRPARLRALLPKLDLGGLLPGPPAVRAALATLALLGFANGMLPYVGAKERLSFAMFSNLRVDQDRWNHLLMPRWLDRRARDGFVRVLEVRPFGAWRFNGKPQGPGLYSPVGLERRLAALARDGGRVELVILQHGTPRRFADAGRNAELRYLVDGLPKSRWFRESLTLGTPQTCVH